MAGQAVRQGCDVATGNSRGPETLGGLVAEPGPPARVPLSVAASASASHETLMAGWFSISLMRPYFMSRPRPEVACRR